MTTPFNLLLQRTSSTLTATCFTPTSRSFATAAQKRAAALRAANNNKTNPSTNGTITNGGTSSATSAPPPPNTSSLPKAPHMTKTTNVKSQGPIAYIVKNPIPIFGIVVPTFVLISFYVIKPELREEAMKRLGFGGGKDDAKSRAKAAVPEDAPALYESGDVEETVVVVVGDTTNNVEASVDDTILGDLQLQPSAAEDGVKETQDLIYAIGFRPHRSS
ncbi:predicted protein [Thalassiosira pseudonana CCMP1335]|uniref:Uncharacterized protein n=1 Tax=Thalassiosira pseudonana TaxID=35128 RepID=B5YP81_THAPS|nr:predicted protein [Thalassiosira pseudonana CCMP1335]ACI64753.1 predicted protein [Thalassiosira pseudonana CCMP1335]